MSLKLFTPLAFASLSQAEIDAFNTTGLPIGVEVYNTTFKRNNKWDGVTWRTVSQFDEQNTLMKSSLSGFMYGAAPIEAIIMAQVFDVNTVFPQNVPFTVCRSLVAPTDATTVDIISIDKITGVESIIGNITFSATPNTMAAVAFPNEITMNVDDIMGIKTRADTNNMGNLFFNIVGYSVLPTYT